MAHPQAVGLECEQFFLFLYLRLHKLIFNMATSTLALFRMLHGLFAVAVP